MAINLNEKPKVMFNLPAVDFYILAAIFISTLLIAVNLISVIGFIPAVIIVVLVVAPVWAYFQYKNILPPHFIVNMIKYYTKKQRIYLPKYEIDYSSELFEAVNEHNKNERDNI